MYELLAPLASDLHRFVREFVLLFVSPFAGRRLRQVHHAEGGGAPPSPGGLGFSKGRGPSVSDGERQAILGQASRTGHKAHSNLDSIVDVLAYGVAPCLSACH